MQGAMMMYALFAVIVVGLFVIVIIAAAVIRAWELLSRWRSRRRMARNFAPKT